MEEKFIEVNNIKKIRRFFDFIYSKHVKKISVLIIILYIFESMFFSKYLLNSNSDIVSILENLNETAIIILCFFVSIISIIIFFADIFISAIIYKLIFKIFKLNMNLKDIFKINLISNSTILVSRLLDILFSNFTAIPLTSISNVISKFDINSNIVASLASIDIFFVINIIFIAVGISVVTRRKFKQTLSVVILSNIISLILSFSISLILS